MRLLLFIMLVSLFVTACGQKGVLYKSPEPVGNKVASTKVSKNASDNAEATTQQPSISQQK
nr:lipoprotein [Shewanella inventionis]